MHMNDVLRELRTEVDGVKKSTLERLGRVMEEWSGLRKMSEGRGLRASIGPGRGGYSAG
jgi:hypothetical protein